MALNAKWGELFGTDESAAEMALASATSPGGGGGEGAPDLKADQGPWTKAGGVAGQLRTSTSSSLTDLSTASEDVAGGTAGFTSTTTLTSVLESWKTRLTTVRDECSRLEGALWGSGRDFGERETFIKQKIAAAVPAQPKSGD
ncbi:hypothetical protein ACFYRC_02220 [Streptomyces sp. NPDC005279]|uniref:hypothetical protein n=1 Tax=Streptomyces sp. NPDC005279 TaxID=3364712 RepID=UPI0036864234